MEDTQVKALCRIRDIYRSITQFELNFQEKHAISLNEGMLLCSLSSNKYSSSQIAEILGLSNSNASKVIKSVEAKGFVKRTLGESDKRQMYFALTAQGSKKIEKIKCEKFDIPELLKSVI